ncbi:unnamed protein product [Rotaria sp. Silwood2]|nr:unnamed protein product [Rotaria sp. Silwood2]CAF4142389.1 unnamed protein product [Rotaria sp. Silwood2]
MTFLLLFILSLAADTCNGGPYSLVRFYENMAEVSQLLGPLPLEFTNDQWIYIRPDSITLLGSNVNVTSTTITEKKKSLDGTQIYVRSPSSFDGNASKFVKGILINESSNMIKIQDESISDKELFLNYVPANHILYLEEPPKPKFYVNFTYDALHDEILHVSYLRSDLNWKTRYQLNLYNDISVLITIAEIRNEGESAISIEQAEIIGGDINLKTAVPVQRSVLLSHDPLFPDFGLPNMRRSFTTTSQIATVEQGEESGGVYVFNIDKPFSIDAKTTLLLPMLRPQVTVERFSLISKYFSDSSSTSKAQRSYRITSDKFLTRGK